MQRELQRLADVAIKHVAEATGGVAYGAILIDLDVKHSMREKTLGTFGDGTWETAGGKAIPSIGINPYSLAELDHREIFRLILQGAIYFVASFTENKILFGFQPSTNLELYPDGYTKVTTNQGRYHGPKFLQLASKIPWLECVKHSDPKIGYTTRLSEAGIKAATKLLKTGIFDGLHKVLEPKSAKRGSQYVSYRCADEACKFSSQVSGGIAKAIDNGEETISQHHGLDMIQK